MRSKFLLGFTSGALVITALLPVFADHRTDPGNIPTQTMFQHSGPAVFTPPPAPPPPPPSLPSTVTPNILNLVNSARSTILQTDTLNLRMNMPKGGLVKNALPPGWDGWDKRYDFQEQGWILFNEAYYTDKFGIIHHHKVTEKTPVLGKLAAEKPSSESKVFEAGAEFNDVLSKKLLAQGSFVPTSTTHVTKVNDTTLQLTKGAVMVLAPASGIKVCTAIGGTSCVTFQGKSIAMVSVYDDKLTVLNLTDACCGSVAVIFPKDAKRQTMAVESGQVLELYHDAQSPTSNLVATRVLTSERLNEHHCCMVCQLNYIRALKKFQLERSLPKKELERVLKTAAAMSSLGR